MAMVVLRHLKHNFKMGVYIFSKVLVIGFAISGFNLPFSKKEISTGVNVMASTASISSINVFVQAKGLNSFPSIPVNKNTGRKEVTTIMVE